MKYTLFFSYQSDTKHEFTFIKYVLEEYVKNSLTSKGIDLKIDYGMRDVAGNPDLLKIMLEKGEKCDIFLADLTYVTNFTNANGDTKNLPNPNVMLELGHAWNFHGNNHTIFIQNKSKGSAKDLPVDLKGFRFPISYKLNDGVSEQKMKVVGENLSVHLTDAIEAVVNSIEAGNKTKYLPFEKFTLCQLHNNSEKFIETKYFEQFSKKIADSLVSNQFVFITGENRCGKSRMIKEFISRAFLQQKLNDILYCKYTQTNTAQLCKRLNELIKQELRRDTVLILDNCNDSIAKEVQSILSSFQHKCIFIMESASSSGSASIKIDPKEYIIEMIANIAPGRESELVEKCGYNPEYIIRTINNQPYTPNTYNTDSDSTTLLSYISLFSKVGFNENLQNEFAHICHLSTLEINKGCSIVKQLTNKGYIISQGGFIFIDSDVVANEYATKMWQQNLADDLSFDELIDKGYLALWFINRQIQVALHNSKCNSFLTDIIKKNLRDISFVDSGLGEYITLRLAELYPKEVLISLEILCNKNKNYGFQKIHGPLWALDKIVRQKGLFDRAITLLLNLQDGALYNKTNIKNIVSDHFKRISYDYNPNVDIESFKKIYKNGHIEIVKDVYSSIFNVGYKILLYEQVQYLKDMFLFLIQIRVENVDWANNIIVKNVLAARHLDISRQVFSEIRSIAEENEVDLNVAEVLSNKIRWASIEDRKSIKALLKSISERNFRTMLYNNVVLFKSDGIPNKDILKSAMNDVATEILQRKGLEKDIDILLRGGRKYDVNCLWFGDAIGQQYENFDKLITKCLDLYRVIPITEHSYGFIIGMFHKYALEDENMSIYKQKRDELLEYPEFIDIAISLSNSCENTICDLRNFEKALIKNLMPLIKLNDLYSISLSDSEYCLFATELIKQSKEGADTGILFLDRARNNNEKIDISNCLQEVVNLYNYWDTPDCNYDSPYSKLIDLLIYSLNTHPNDSLAKSIIISMVKWSNSQYFNNNCSLVDLFRILIKKYQSFFLECILNDDSFETYRNKHNLEELFKFQHEADDDVYLKWCDENGSPAVSFIASFIQILKEKDTGNFVWTDGVKTLMNKHCNDSYVLNNISTRLFNGEVGIAKYSGLKNIYELLIDDENETIRLWATEQSENMDEYIKREEEKIEVESIWNK